jgi:hypothetical protein
MQDKTNERTTKMNIPFSEVKTAKEISGTAPNTALSKE